RERGVGELIPEGKEDHSHLTPYGFRRVPDRPEKALGQLPSKHDVGRTRHREKLNHVRIQRLADLLYLAPMPHSAPELIQLDARRYECLELEDLELKPRLRLGIAIGQFTAPQGVPLTSKVVADVVVQRHGYHNQIGMIGEAIPGQ